MFQIMAMLIEGAAGFVPTIPALAVYHGVMRRRDAALKMRTAGAHIAGTYAFCLLAVAVFAATGVPNVYSLRLEATVNLVPFAHGDYLQYGLNVLLFVPLGFLLPMLWTKFAKIRMSVLYGAAFSLIIELGQLFTFRATDIDDLLLNTAGAAIGAGAFALVRRLVPKVAVFAIDGAAHWKHERKFYFAFAWLSMFLVPPVIADWIWGLLPFIYNR